MPFTSKSQQRFMFARHPKIAKEFAKKTDFSKLPEKAEGLAASSSASGPALFKEDIPRRIQTADIFMNENKMPHAHRIGADLNTAEQDTMMGRFAKRMTSRDYIDGLNLGLGTKAQRAGKAAMADMGIPHQMVIGGVAKEKLKEGMSIEKEHTPDPAIQAKIAKDHLKEDLNYYPKLKKAGL